MSQDKKKIISLLIILFVLVVLTGAVTLVKKNQETRKGAAGSPMPSVGYPCNTQCKAQFCHEINMRWNKGDCPSETPYCCQE
jgi:hypothetical protein